MLKSLLYDVARGILLALIQAVRLYILPRTAPSTEGCVFYEGVVMHSRKAPAKHSFLYQVRYCLVDVTDVPKSPYVASLLAAGKRMSLAEAQRLSGCNGQVRALLMPESAGFEENPICVYYCCAPLLPPPFAFRYHHAPHLTMSPRSARGSGRR